MASEQKEERIPIFNARTSQVEEAERVVKTEEEWKKLLTPEQFRVTRLQGTERPFSGTCPIPRKGESGIYQCVCCGIDLFKVETKFESGTGWPSFWEPVSDLNIREQADGSLGMKRTEVLCARCAAHLGHVFDDGPQPTGKRYCINAAALKFEKLGVSAQQPLEKATFAAGCFWGVEAAFRQVKGVKDVTSGFTGGTRKNPTYEEVCLGDTGHAEAVQIEFDPSVVTYEKLLDVFWSIHDPTTYNRQGPDIGSQYRSAVFTHSTQQEKAALLSAKKLSESGRFKSPLATEIVRAGEFYKAEDYHQRYYEKHGLKPTCHVPLN